LFGIRYLILSARDRPPVPASPSPWSPSCRRAWGTRGVAATQEKRRVPLKAGEIIKLLETDGWYLIATRGSHRQYKHPGQAT